MTCVPMHLLSMVQGSGMRWLFMYPYPSDLIETDLNIIRILLIMLLIIFLQTDICLFYCSTQVYRYASISDAWIMPITSIFIEADVCLFSGSTCTDMPVSVMPVRDPAVKRIVHFHKNLINLQ